MEAIPSGSKPLGRSDGGFLSWLGYSLWVSDAASSWFSLLAKFLHVQKDDIVQRFAQLIKNPMGSVQRSEIFVIATRKGTTPLKLIGWNHLLVRLQHHSLLERERPQCDPEVASSERCKSSSGIRSPARNRKKLRGRRAKKKQEKH